MLAYWLACSLLRHLRTVRQNATDRGDTIANRRLLVKQTRPLNVGRYMLACQHTATKPSTLATMRTCYMSSVLCGRTTSSDLLRSAFVSISSGYPIRCFENVESSSTGSRVIKERMKREIRKVRPLMSSYKCIYQNSRAMTFSCNVCFGLSCSIVYRIMNRS